MTRVLVAVVVALSFCMPAAHGQVPAPPKIPLDAKNIVQGTAEDYAALNSLKEPVFVKLLTADDEFGEKKKLVFRIEYYESQPNADWKPPAGPNQQNIINQQNQNNQKYQGLMQRQQKALANTNLQQRQQELQRVQQELQQLMQTIAQQQAQQQQQSDQQQAEVIKQYQNNTGPYILIHKAKDFSLEVADSVIVRRLKPALEYDDKGSIKEYSKTDLEKLHLVDNKDKAKPGYPAKYEDLAANQIVKIYLTPAPKAAKKPAELKDKDAPAEKKPADKIDGDKKKDPPKKDADEKKDPEKKTGDTSTQPTTPRPTVRAIIISDDPANDPGIAPALPPLKTAPPAGK